MVDIDKIVREAETRHDRSRVILKNIAPACLSRVDLKYVVEVYWRDNETI